MYQGLEREFGSWRQLVCKNIAWLLSRVFSLLVYSNIRQSDCSENSSSIESISTNEENEELLQNEIFKFPSSIPNHFRSSYLRSAQNNAYEGFPEIHTMSPHELYPFYSDNVILDKCIVTPGLYLLSVQLWPLGAPALQFLCFFAMFCKPTDVTSVIHVQTFSRIFEYFKQEKKKRVKDYFCSLKLWDTFLNTTG